MDAGPAIPGFSVAERDQFVCRIGLNGVRYSMHFANRASEEVRLGQRCAEQDCCCFRGKRETTTNESRDRVPTIQKRLKSQLQVNDEKR